MLTQTINNSYPKIALPKLEQNPNHKTKKGEMNDESKTINLIHKENIAKEVVTLQHQSASKNP
jgi:hypothetical protein